MISDRQYLERIEKHSDHGPGWSAFDGLHAHLVASFDRCLADVVEAAEDPEAALRAEGFVWLADALYRRSDGPTAASNPG